MLNMLYDHPDHREIVEIAVRSVGEALECASERLRQDRELLRIAVNESDVPLEPIENEQTSGLSGETGSSRVVLQLDLLRQRVVRRLYWQTCNPHSFATKFLPLFVA